MFNPDFSSILLMSATDEQLDFVHSSGMDHVTYVLIGFRWTIFFISFHWYYYLITFNNSFSFLLYAFIVFLINLYSTTGRNAPSKTTATNVSNIELTTTTEGGRQWYRRLPSRNNRMHGYGYVLGDDEEDEMMPRWYLALWFAPSWLQLKVIVLVLQNLG